MGAIRLRTVPMFGTGIVSKSFVSNRQRRLNVYFGIRQDKDKSRFAVYNTPGLTLLGKTTDSFPLRAMLSNNQYIFMVSGSTFRAATGFSGGAVTATLPTSGVLTTRRGFCSLAANTNDVVIADGSVGYLYDITKNILTPVGEAFPNNSNTVTYVSGFFVAEEPGTQKFWVSDFNDATTWDGLSFASASAYPGSILAVDSCTGNLVIFSTDHIEFWQDVGGSPEPFAPVVSAAREYGLGALWSRSHVGEALCFLAQNTEGQFQIAQVSGFDLEIISTPDIDYLLNTFPDASQAVSMSFGEDAHKFYVITFPITNRTFFYDMTTQMWGEMQTGTSLVPSRHIGNLSAPFGGQIIVSDYFNSNIYTFDSKNFTDNGVANAREIITRHILSDFNRIRIAQLYLDMETGVGTQSGQGSDPMIMLSYSKDNGRTWCSERWARLGKVGEYLTRVIWRRFGSTRDAVFRIRMTDPVKFVLTDAALTIKEHGRSQNRAQAQGRME